MRNDYSARDCRRAMFSACSEVLEVRRLLSAALISDINTTGSSNPSGFTPFADEVYFVANDGAHGNELWKSDGTMTGTQMVADIATGAASSDPSELTVVGDTLFFAATDSSGDRELYKLESGTVSRVEDIRSGSDSSDPMNLTAVGDTLFFTAFDGTHGRELWKSDGTESGTVLVDDLTSGGASSFTGEEALEAIGVSLFFSTTDPNSSDGRGDLWATDGTAPGTVHLAEVSDANRYGVWVTPAGNAVYFVKSHICDPDTGWTESRLWRTDGTAEGTAEVFNADGYNVWLSNLTNMSDVLSFVRSDLDGSTLYRLDPQVDTEPVSVAVFGDVYELMPSDDALLFLVAGPQGTGNECLYLYDGSGASTALLLDLNTEEYVPAVRNLVTYDGTVYFTIDGSQFWRSDGTAEGTEQIALGTSGYAPWYVTNIGDNLFFSADDATHGRELWKLPLPPYSPSNATATLIGETSLTLDWADRSDNETGFEVEKSTNGGESFTPAGTTDADETSLPLTNLTLDTDYVFRVRAIGDDENSIWRTTPTIRTLVEGQPIAPSDVEASADTIDGHRMHLSWTDNSDNESGFTVEQLQSDGESWEPVATAEADQTCADATDLYSNNDYSFRVIANAPFSGGNAPEGGESEDPPPDSRPSDPAEQITSEGDGIVFQGDPYGSWIDADGVEVSWESTAPDGRFYELLNDTITLHATHLPKHTVVDLRATWSSVANDGDDSLTIAAGSDQSTRAVDYGSDSNDLYLTTDHHDDSVDITIRGQNWSSAQGTFGYEKWAINAVTLSLKGERVTADDVTIQTAAAGPGRAKGDATGSVKHYGADGQLSTALQYKIKKVWGAPGPAGALKVDPAQVLGGNQGVTGVKFIFDGTPPGARPRWRYWVQLEAIGHPELVCQLQVIVQ